MHPPTKQKHSNYFNNKNQQPLNLSVIYFIFAQLYF